MKPETNVFIHRRDFRIQDNAALLSLVEAYPDVPVLHCFFFNKNCVEFMVQLHGHMYFFYVSASSMQSRGILTTH